MYKSRHRADYSGRRFGRWAVLGDRTINRTPGGGQSVMWLCRCDCGAEKKVDVGSLRNGTSTGCRDCSDKRNGLLKAIAHGFVEGQPRLSQTRWYRTLQGAKRRGREVTISRDEVVAIMVRQQCKCAVTGWPISLPTRTRGPLAAGGTASLDRIDNNQGYVPGNVRWTHWTINKMKGALSEAEFLRACRAVVEAAQSS